MFINVMCNFRIHVAVPPVFIMRPASMDLQTRDTSAYVQRVTLEKTVKKVSLIFCFSLLTIFHAAGQALISINLLFSFRQKLVYRKYS